MTTLNIGRESTAWSPETSTWQVRIGGIVGSRMSVAHLPFSALKKSNGLGFANVLKAFQRQAVVNMSLGCAIQPIPCFFKISVSLSLLSQMNRGFADCSFQVLAFRS